jgi:hypothetical protein
MNIEEIKNKLEELQKDPKASELIEGHDKTDKAEAIADVAQKLGYDLKVVDLKEYMSAMEAEIKARTEAVADNIVSIHDDELDAVAGGSQPMGPKHGNCKDTFLNRENCWWNDGCDAINTKYWNYIPGSCGRPRSQNDPDPNRMG